MPGRPKKRRIPKARRIARPPRSRIDVSRGEYDRIIAILNEGNAILKALREAVAALERDSRIQFTRIAQIQADLDEIGRAREKFRLPA